METNPDSRRTIEDLKEAGEELKEVSGARPDRKEEKPQSPPSLTRQVKEEVDLVKKITGYQKELSQEQSLLEKSHQQVKELEKRLAGRIELLKRLQNKSREIGKELKEFEEQLGFAKKENQGLLDEIKDKLADQNE